MKQYFKISLPILFGILLLSSCGENVNTNTFTPNMNVNNDLVVTPSTNQYFNFNENVPFWMDEAIGNTNTIIDTYDESRPLGD